MLAAKFAALEETMRISNSYINNGLWDIFNASSANPEEVAGGQNNPTKLASGDTVLISDEARQLLSEALLKYHNGELNQNSDTSASSIPGVNIAENKKIEDESPSLGNQTGGSGGAGGSSGASDSESIKKQIEKLQGQLHGLLGQLGGNSGDASISAKIASIQSQIAELQAQLSA